MNITRTEIIPKETKKKEYKNENRNDTNNDKKRTKRKQEKKGGDKVHNKKTRRKRSMNKKLRCIKGYYMNIRGIKSKLESLQTIIEEERPDIIGMTETITAENDCIEIKGYEMIRNDRDNEGGGVLLAVKEELWKTLSRFTGTKEQKKAYG